MVAEEHPGGDGGVEEPSRIAVVDRSNGGEPVDRSSHAGKCAVRGLRDDRNEVLDPAERRQDEDHDGGGGHRRGPHSGEPPALTQQEPHAEREEEGAVRPKRPPAKSA